LIELAHDFGAKVMVHGSPMARQIPEGADPAPFRERALDSFARIAPDAEAAGITYCIEPLAASETNFLNTLAEAKAMLDELASPALRTMIDTCAAAQAEAEPVAAVIARWLPTGLIAHVQVNDRNRAGPGQGGDQFAPILAALARARYHGAIAVEPFVYKPDGAGAAARAIGYLRGILEAQAHPTHRNPQS
jgi:sugar phosphate isomerase/epimerase